MNLKFELKPNIGIGPVKLGSPRSVAIDSMGLAPESFMKTPMSVHPTDSFYDAGFQIFYEGLEPVVESIELSRGCGFDAILSGVNILDLPVNDALLKVEELTGIKPQTEDDGYTYEIDQLGFWLWRPTNETEGEDGLYFSTIGIGHVST